MAKPTPHRDKWRIRWLDEHGKRQSAVFDEYKVAQRELSRHQVEVEEIGRGVRNAAPPEKTFGDLCDYWIENRAPRKRSRKDDESIIRKHLRPAFGATVEECQHAFADYWGYLQLEGDTPAQVYSVTTSAMRPMEEPGGALTRYTVGVFNGGHGRAKSSRQNAVRRTIDPREPASTALPGNPDDLTIHCENTGCVSLENLSGLRARESDHLCRISTGDGKTKRSLYSNRDEEIFRGSRPILMNGIGDIVVRDDLLDRSLVMVLSKPKKRKSDKAVEAEFVALWPRVFGAFLFCMQKAIAHAATTRVDENIRMVEAAQWAAAGELAAGFDQGTVSRVYVAARGHAAELAKDDSVVQALLDVRSTVWSKRTEWSGQAKELLAVLTRHIEKRGDSGRPTNRRPDDWPKKARGLRAVLDRKLDALAELGMIVTFGAGRTETSSKAKLISITWKREPAAEAKGKKKGKTARAPGELNGSAQRSSPPEGV